MPPLPPAPWFKKTRTSKRTEMHCARISKHCYCNDCRVGEESSFFDFWHEQSGILQQADPWAQKAPKSVSGAKSCQSVNFPVCSVCQKLGVYSQQLPITAQQYAPVREKVDLTNSRGTRSEWQLQRWRVVAWRGGAECSGKKKGSVGRETNAVSDMRVMIVQSRHQKPRHPLSHQLQKHEVDVCREQETPEAEVSLRSSIGRRANTSWKVLAPNRSVSIGILPVVNSIKLNRDVSSAQSAHSRTGRLKSNQTKSPKRVMTKVKLLLRIVCDSWVVYHRTPCRQNLQRFLGRAQKCWNELPTLWSLRTDLQERLQGYGDAPAEMRGKLAKNIFKLKKRKTKLHSIRLLRSGFWRPHPQ